MELTKVTDIVGDSAKTYEDVLKYHLVHMSDEIRGLNPETLIIVGCAEGQNFYYMIKSDTLNRTVGCLEFTKTYLITQALDDDEEI